MRTLIDTLTFIAFGGAAVFAIATIFKSVSGAWPRIKEILDDARYL